MFYGIHMGDFQGIGDNGSGGTAPAAGPKGVFGDVGHHEKIMGKVFLPDDVHFMLHPLSHRPVDRPIPPPAPLHGAPVETVVGLPVRHLLKIGEYDLGEIPVR